MISAEKRIKNAVDTKVDSDKKIWLYEKHTKEGLDHKKHHLVTSKVV